MTESEFTSIPLVKTYKTNVVITRGLAVCTCVFLLFRMVGGVNHHLGVAIRLVWFGSELFKLSRRIMGISVWVECVRNFLARRARATLGVRLRRIAPQIPTLTRCLG